MSSLKTLVSILAKPAYAILAISVAALVFIGAVWLPNLELIYIVMQQATVPEVLSLLWSLVGAIETNFSRLSASYTIAIAILFGINVTLLTYYIRKVRRTGGVQGMGGTGVLGLGGLISGIFGIGCAACGTFILTTFLTLFGATGVLALLPYGGQEFGSLGVVLLLVSVALLLKKIQDPLVCNIA